MLRRPALGSRGHTTLASIRLVAVTINQPAASAAWPGRCGMQCTLPHCYTATMMINIACTSRTFGRPGHRSSHPHSNNACNRISAGRTMCLVNQIFQPLGGWGLSWNPDFCRFRAMIALSAYFNILKIFYPSKKYQNVPGTFWNVC